MVCPHCGEANFQWASVCDHCRGRLHTGNPPGEPESAAVPVADGTYIDPDAILEQRFHAILAAATPAVFVTTALVVINGVIFGLMTARGVSPTRPDVDALIRWGAIYGPRISAGEWWRLLSAAFLHAGIVHIGMNMLALWSAGRTAERVYGQPAFVAVYLVSAVAASLASVIVHPTTVSVGASGAIFGVYGSLIAFVVICRASLPSEVRSTLGWNLAGFVAYNFLFGLITPHIDGVAHAAGLAAGVVTGAAMVRPLGSPTSGRVVRAIAVSAISALLLVAAARLVPVYDDWGARMTAWAQTSAKTDARYAEGAAQLSARQLTPEQFADLIERDLIPDLLNQRSAIDRLKLTAAQRQQEMKVLAYLTLKTDALRLSASALRTGDAAVAAEAEKKNEDAIAAMLAIAPNAETAGRIADLTHQREIERAFIEELKRIEQFDAGIVDVTNTALKRLRVNHWPPGEAASFIEREGLVPWNAERQRFERLAVPPDRASTRARVLQYMTLRGEALQLLADGIRSNNPALGTRAKKKLADAAKVLANPK
jgi:membrane associated rhomboid family serine protease